MSGFVNTIDLLGDRALTDALIEGTLEEFYDNTVTHIHQSLFQNNTYLKKVDLPNATIAPFFLFAYCTNLQEVNLPKATGNTRTTFRRCYNLTKVNMPLIKNIYYDAFQDCMKLQMLDFHNLTMLSGSNVFAGCTALTALILRNTNQVCTLDGTNHFSDNAISNGTGYIYVPRDLVNSYKTATNWTVYANQFRALEDYTVDGTVTGELDESKI